MLTKICFFSSYLRNGQECERKAKEDNSFNASSSSFFSWFLEHQISILQFYILSAVLLRKGYFLVFRFLPVLRSNALTKYCIFWIIVDLWNLSWGTFRYWHCVFWGTNSWDGKFRVQTLNDSMFIYATVTLHILEMNMRSCTK